MDIKNDLLMIDNIISSDVCLAGLTAMARYIPTMPPTAQKTTIFLPALCAKF